MERRRCSVAIAALRLGQTYHRTLRDLFVGRIRGGRDDDGHYWLDEGDVERLARHRSTSTTGARIQHKVEVPPGEPWTVRSK